MLWNVCSVKNGLPVPERKVGPQQGPSSTALRLPLDDGYACSSTFARKLPRLSICL